MSITANQIESEIYQSSKISFSKLAIYSGFVGGLLEALWVMVFSLFNPLTIGTVGREITNSVIPSLAASPSAPIIGLGIHFALSFLVAAGFIALLYRPFLAKQSRKALIVSSMVTLTAIWAVNFFVLLPAINPTFVTLIPYMMTFVSKLLFGYGMANVIYKMKK
jgi:hypothetical protein